LPHLYVKIFVSKSLTWIERTEASSFDELQWENQVLGIISSDIHCLACGQKYRCNKLSIQNITCSALCVRKGSDILLCKSMCKCYVFCNMHSWSSLNLEHLLLIVRCTEQHFLLLRNLTFYSISLAIVWTIICRPL
jgi:hypothetical protein